MKRKLLVLFVSIIMMIVVILKQSNIMVVEASIYIGTLNYWKSDGGSIARWTEPYYSISAVKTDSTNTVFNGYFTAGVLNARNEWDDALGTSTVVHGYLNTSATFNVYGGKVNDILNACTSFSSWDFATNTTGLTKYLGYELWGVFRYYTSGTYYVDKTANELLSVVCCVVDKEYTNNYKDKTKNTCIHEIGHAFGWIDHSTSSSDVMYPYVTTILTLTNNDKQHLSQVYLETWN